VIDRCRKRSLNSLGRIGLSRIFEKESMMRKGILFLTLLLLLSNTGLFSQAGMGNGRIKGEIRSETGVPVQGVKVTVVNLTYKQKFTSVSDKKGRWAVSGVAAGLYQISVSKEGFQEATIDFPLSLAKMLVHSLDITLRSEGSGPSEASPVGRPDPREAALSKLLQEGNALYAQQKYEEARIVFENLLKENTETYQIHINIGNCYVSTKQYDQAIAAYMEYLNKAAAKKTDLQGDAEAAGVLSAVGQAYMEKGDVERAKEYFQKAISVLPRDEILPYNVGVILLNQGDTENAIKYLRMAIEIKESWGAPHLRIGYAFLRAGEYTSAAEHLKRFLELSPDSPEAPQVRNQIPQIEDLAQKKK